MTSEPVSFVSRDTVLVIGARDRTLAILDRLRPPLRVVAFIPDAVGDLAARPNLRIVAAPITGLSGHLGSFAATTLPLNDEPVDAGRFGWNDDSRFDQVLDLTEPPLLAHEVSPLGYFAPTDDAQLTAALDRIRSQPHVSQKPRYFEYDPGRCTHGAAGLIGCSRCLDACPAGAIAGAGAEVRFDPFLCQGCGSCTAVCPDGAVRYAFPSAETALETVRVSIGKSRNAGGDAPRLVVVSAEGDMTKAPSLASAPDSLVHTVHALASCGIEVWFSALAWGASQVLLLAGENTTKASLRALRSEIATAQAILTALGEPPTRIVLIEGADQVPPAPERSIGGVSAGPLPVESKRSTLYAAVDHLVQRASALHAPVPLPAGSSFGAVVANADRCTLCLGCVNLCPTSALSSGSDAAPQLRFTESRCVQCGLCERGCPEEALHLVPRIRLVRGDREIIQVLRTDEAAECTGCGAPFMSRRALARSMAIVEQHPLLRQMGFERLRLCMRCRADATMRET